MADFRTIYTRIWTDAWFSELEQDEKLLFVYLFSNPNASVCGMYEMPKRNISIDTGISIGRVTTILDKFANSGKVYYENGIVWVVNLKKYNDSGNSVKIQERARKDLDAISDCNIKRMYYKYHNIPYPKLQIPYPKKISETIQTETDTETETRTETETPTPLTPQVEDRVDAPIGAGGGVHSWIAKYSEITGIKPRASDIPKWRQEAQDCISAGIGADLIRSTVDYMRSDEKKLTVGSPKSIYNVALNLKAKQKPQTKDLMGSYAYLLEDNEVEA
jgi:hypothetical protein